MRSTDLFKIALGVVGIRNVQVRVYEAGNHQSPRSIYYLVCFFIVVYTDEFDFIVGKYDNPRFDDLVSISDPGDDRSVLYQGSHDTSPLTKM